MTPSAHQHQHGHEGEIPAEGLFSAGFWDQRYRSSTAVWSGRPNPQLVAEAASLQPGDALDAGCGEGADAIWLAERGWRVTAVDISTVALERGAANARQVGSDVAGRITWQQVDLLTWGPLPQTYGLVSAQFMQLPAPQRDALFGRLAGGVAQGGTLLIVGHSPTDLQTTAARPPLPELFFTADEIAAALDPLLWKVIVSETRPREGRDPDGSAVTVHDEVLAARRS
ncbi:MAG: SAM-dependent methyltransferase [Acidimicrobiales bacterium]|jgi:SAM-dependent methyltransferase